MIGQWLGTIVEVISKWGYLGVFVSAMGILPAEVVMTIVGAIKPEFISLIKIATAGALGEVVGAILTYLLGYYFNNKDIIGFLNGKGKWLNVDEESFNKSTESLKKRGFIYLFLTRFTPGIRVVTLLVAGYLKYNLWITSVAVFLGTVIYAFGFAYLGSKIGFDLAKINNAINTVNNSMVFASLTVVAVIIYLNRKKIGEWIKGLIEEWEEEEKK